MNEIQFVMSDADEKVVISILENTTQHKLLMSFFIQIKKIVSNFEKKIRMIQGGNNEK